MVVGNPLQMRSIDLLSNLKLDTSVITLSTKLRNIGIVYDENLILKYQVAALKNKIIGGIINIVKNIEVYRQSQSQNACMT